MKVIYARMRIATQLYIMIVLSSLLLLPANVVEPQNIAKHLVKLQAQKKGDENVAQLWRKNRKLLCKKLGRTLERKEMVLKRLAFLNHTVGHNKNLSQDDRHFQLETFRLLSQELNETEHLIYQAIAGLSDSMKGDWKNILNIKESSKIRLEALRAATLLEEQEYNAVLNAEKEKKDIEKHRNHSAVLGMVDEILSEVSLAADKLELKLEDHMFDEVAAAQSDKADKIEAVIRLPDEENEENADKEELAKEERDGKGGKVDDSVERANRNMGVIKLVDSQNNQFVLTKGKDSTVPHEDKQLIKDIVFSICLAYGLGLLCQAVGFPSMFGYIVGGIILGPSGLNYLKSLVQLETIGEFGAFFILFAVGLEFSPEKLKRVLKVAVLGSSSMMLLMSLLGLALGWLMDMPTKPSCFIGACLSLSSTPLIVKFLASPSTGPSPVHVLPTRTNRRESGGSDQSDTEYGSILMGILIMQDVLLGILVAVLPAIAGHSKSMDTSSTMQYFILVCRLLAAMFGILLCSFFLSRYIIGHLFNWIFSMRSKELLVIASVVLAFFMLMVTDYAKLSMEFGCFLAGVMLSSQGKLVVEEVESLFLPIRDIFSVVFFASIGLHVFPTFVAVQLTMLTTLTMLVVIGKLLVGLAVLHCLLPSQSSHAKWLVSAGLAQVSEFSFVLGSRARRLGLISREVYLLVLSVTTLSLLWAPLLWKLSLWYQKTSARYNSWFTRKLQGKQAMSYSS